MNEISIETKIEVSHKIDEPCKTLNFNKSEHIIPCYNSNYSLSKLSYLNELNNIEN